jgi:hypothetical protein
VDWSLGESSRYVTPELIATLGEEQLRKTEFVLSANIKLTRSLSADTQSAVTSGQATINQSDHDEVIEIIANTPGELVDVSTVKLEDGREVQVLGVCFDEDSSKVLYFIYGTLAEGKVNNSYRYPNGSQTGFFLLAEDIKFTESTSLLGSNGKTYKRGTGIILYGDAYYSVKATVRQNWAQDHTAWPFLRAKVIVIEDKKVTAKKATGRVVQ